MPWIRVFSLAPRTGVLSEAGYWTLESGNIQRGGIGTVCQIGSKSGKYFRNITGHAKGDCAFVIVKRYAETYVL